MYKTKKEVDAHVHTALSKIRSESERYLRSYTIARLYYKINEYSSAEQYLRSYLNVKEDNDQAHKLLGQCYQRMKKPDKALQSFQRSLQLNPKQPDVLVEVCQLLIEDTNLNTNKAKYWCELAESEKVQHDAVFSLRLRLMNKDNLPVNQVEELIQKEIAARPNDVQLRVRLVRNFIEQNKIMDAFKYAYNLEMNGNDVYASSSEWYNIVWLALNKYEQLPNTKKDWEFWLMLIICLERQVYISFAHSTSSTTGGVTETANLLFNLDQYLFKITQLADKLCAQKELVSLFLLHYSGQLLLHAAALIFKRELLQNKNKWKETVKSVLPLLLLAYQCDTTCETKEHWMKHCDEQGKQLLQLWNREGSFRCAQVGRTLLSCIADETADKENATFQINNMLSNQPTLWNSCDELLAQIRQTCSDKQWRRNVFALLFCNSDHKVKEQSSLLIKYAKLNEPQYELPTYAQVERYEELAQYHKPQSLQHMVYLCLGNDNLSYVRAKFFSGLNFSTQNLAFCGAESLNQLDVDTFLYAATLQAKRMLEVDRDAFENYNSGNRNAAGKPRILPFVNLQAQLCTEEQINWWTAAYQVYKNLTCENLAEIRANLQYGIEAVRGINGPKIDMIIVFKLGQIFVARAQDIVKPVEKAYLEARAESIYTYGLNMVKMNNKSVLEPFRKYFKYPKSNTSAVEREVTNAAEDAISYLASRFFKKAEYEELIEELAGIQLPFATYLQAEAYRKLDEANKTPKKTKRMYLDRASECLNQTLSLLKNTQTDPNHPLNSIIHSELKRVQQASNRYRGDSPHFSPASAGLHNNSSTYEDAETDFFADSPVQPIASSINRSRREAVAAAALASPRNMELENLVKQMANTLTFVKEEIVDTIKPEVVSMRKEITSLKDKITNLEEAMKKSRISSNPPSRDDASHVLDDLYMIEDALQNQLYNPTPAAQLPPPHNNLYPMNNFNTPVAGAPHSLQQPQQPRIHTPNAASMQQIQQNAAAAAAAAAAAYNSPLFNPNYPMNYYTPQYMMPPQGAAGAGAALGQRNPMSLPYMDASGGMNFNMPPTGSLLPPQPPQPPTQDQQRTPSNLYGLLTPQQPTPQQPPLQQSTQQLQGPPLAPLMPQLAATISMPQLNTQLATTTTTTASAIIAPQPTPLAQFNKVVNNQPVEKGPPANVVITNSDPLPNLNTAPIQTQQPTLSVTIPSHHIKSSLVTSNNDATAISIASAPTQPSSIFTGFNLNSSTGTPTFGGFGDSSTKNTTTVTAKATSTVFGNNKTPAVSAVSPSTFSFKPQIDAQAAKTAADESLNKTADSIGSEQNRSGAAADAEVEYDPRPDFKPIIPLPAEIEVRTGEEDEEVMFCHRAKLFRFIDKDWKERGIGDIKILKNKDGSSRILMRRDLTHKICANHKITSDQQLTTPKNETKGHIWIANDFADEELKLETFFVRFKLAETAQQFSEAFKKAQADAKKTMAPPAAVAEVKTKNKVSQSISSTSTTSSKPMQFTLAKSAVTNFATSTPAAKPTGVDASSTLNKPFGKQSNASTATTAVTTATVSKTLFGSAVTSTPNVSALTSSTQTKQGAVSIASPFANFSFDKTVTATASSTTTTEVATTTTTSSFANIFSNLGKSQPSPFSTANLPSSFAAVVKNSAPGSEASVLSKSSASDGGDDEYVPTAQFNPVIPLPDLIEVTTGEENEIVLFEHRAKLLRFDKDAGEWKERGLGNMKLLQDKQDVNKVRLVMRREQIHKLCCNQRLYKDTSFKYAKNSVTALAWAGRDFSENELVTEMLTVRFKTADICKQFHDAIVSAQAKMSSEAVEGNAMKQEAADKNAKQAVEKESVKQEETPKGFGDAFKPKPGAWSCQACYTSNTADKMYCLACENPKDDTVPKKDALLTTSSNATTTFKFGSFNFGTNPASSDTATKPIFGFSSAGETNAATLASARNNASVTTPAARPAAATTAAPPQPPAGAAGFGDKFKPKAGSWTCQSCYLSNTGDAIYCSACEAPKDDTVAKKEPTHNILALSDPTQKFSFGFPAAQNTAETKPSSSITATTGFSFGAKSTATPASTSNPPLFGSNLASTANTDASKSFNFTTPSATSTTLNPSISKPTFSFSLQSKAMASPAMPTSASCGSASPFTLSNKTDLFKSPGKFPLKFGSGGGGDADGVDDGEDGDQHFEEENNTYFTPVIPLPDKIVVKTGEEDEELLYVHRAKLYRFVDGEWKERGLGDVKILRHKETKKLRVVMRREQILKICLNHVLNEDVDYKSKDDKSWLFVVNDFSEGEVELHKFSLRFKNKEIAENFMDAIRNALSGKAVAIESTSLTPSTTSLSSTTANKSLNISDSDKKTAEALNEFFEDKPDCTGCRGCNVDTFEFPTVNSSEPFVDEDDAINPPLPMELPQLALPKHNRSLLKQSALATTSTTSSPATMFPKSDKQLSENIFKGFGGANSTAFGNGGTTEKATPTSANTTFSFTAALKSTTQDENKPVKSGFLFGSADGATSGGPLFGGDKKLPVFGQTPSIFGGANKTANSTTDTLNNTEKPKSIFDGGSTATASTGGSIFGGNAVFGGSSLAFGSSAANNSTSIFGGSNSTQSAGNGTGNSIFGSSTTFSGFGASVGTKSTTQPSLFGGSTTAKTSIFDQMKQESLTVTPATTFADLSSKVDNDFASLAAKANITTSPGEKTGKSGFIGLTNTDAFSSFLKTNNSGNSTTKSTTEANPNESFKSVEDEGGNDENYDPHYEPIIALPNEIVVSTGEEDERKLFGDRATLFRWDGTNKEWKERGVGEIKILLHPSHQTYRMVMRREQIFKLVLNCAIGAEFIFSNMNNNPKSFVWASMNYAESTEGVLEKLAIRFKKLDIAEKFGSQLKECIEAAKKRAENTTQD